MARILVIQKDEPLVRLMSRALTEEGYDVIVAPGEDAPRDLGMRSRTFLLNTDTAEQEKRPIIDALRWLAPGTAIIDLARDGDGEECGADVVVPSPYHMSELLARVRMLAPPTSPIEKTSAPAA